MNKFTKAVINSPLPEVLTEKTESGLSFLYQYFPSRIVHLGFVVKAGTRDETADLMGTAHCLEHMLFKGTKRRKAWHILTALDKYGGELNAYTTREFTAYFASVSAEFADKAINLLADMYRNASLPEKELAKEKSIIGDEIDMYADTPDERIQDEMQDLIFPGHPLGFNILGNRATLESINRASLLDFKQKFYVTGNTAFFFSGGLPQKQILHWVTREFGGSSQNVERLEIPPQDSNLFENTVETQFQQSHCMLAGRAYPGNHLMKPALALMNNILGGPGMNSRLNMGIREKYGFTYQIESNYQPYRDSGIFSVYFATEPGRLQKTRKLILSELEKLRTQLNERMLAEAKRQFIGQMRMAEESRLGLLLSLCKQYLDLGKIETFEQAEQRIKAVSLDDAHKVANEVMNADKLSALLYKGTGVKD